MKERQFQGHYVNSQLSALVECPSYDPDWEVLLFLAVHIIEAQSAQELLVFNATNYASRLYRFPGNYGDSLAESPNYATFASHGSSCTASLIPWLTALC